MIFLIKEGRGARYSEEGDQSGEGDLSLLERVLGSSFALHRQSLGFEFEEQ